MHPISIESSIESRHPIRLVWALAALATLVALVGCATRKEALLPHGDATMLDLWNQHAGDEASPGRASLQEARSALRRPLTNQESTASRSESSTYTRTAENEINAQFERLPDPDLILYVFPHLAGADPVPVPGYSTVFSFYERVHYAMPGERTRAF